MEAPRPASIGKAQSYDGLDTARIHRNSEPPLPKGTIERARTDSGTRRRAPSVGELTKSSKVLPFVQSEAEMFGSLVGEVPKVKTLRGLSLGRQDRLHVYCDTRRLLRETRRALSSAGVPSRFDPKDWSFRGVVVALPRFLEFEARVSKFSGGGGSGDDGDDDGEDGEHHVMDLVPSNGAEDSGLLFYRFSRDLWARLKQNGLRAIPQRELDAGGRGGLVASVDANEEMSKYEVEDEAEGDGKQPSEAVLEALVDGSMPEKELRRVVHQAARESETSLPSSPTSSSFEDQSNSPWTSPKVTLKKDWDVRPKVAKKEDRVVFASKSKAAQCALQASFLADKLPAVLQASIPAEPIESPRRPRAGSAPVDSHGAPTAVALLEAARTDIALAEACAVTLSIARAPGGAAALVEASAAKVIASTILRLSTQEFRATPTTPGYRPSATRALAAAFAIDAIAAMLARAADPAKIREDIANAERSANTAPNALIHNIQRWAQPNRRTLHTIPTSIAVGHTMRQRAAFAALQILENTKK